jgi:hypothetical protein
MSASALRPLRTHSCRQRQHTAARLSDWNRTKRIDILRLPSTWKMADQLVELETETSLQDPVSFIDHDKLHEVERKGCGPNDVIRFLMRLQT